MPNKPNKYTPTIIYNFPTGSKPTLSVCVDGVRSLPGDKSEVIIYIVERQTNGATRRILATELYAFLSQDANKTKLKGLGVENMIAKTALSESQLSQVCFINFYIFG